MEFLFDIADFLILGSCFAAIALSAVVYRLERQRRWLLAVIYFAFLILIEEYLHISETGAVLSAWLDEVFYSFAVGKSMLYIVCAYLLMALFTQITNVSKTAMAVILSSLLALWLFLFPVIRNQSNLTSFLYLFPYQLYTLALSLWGLHRLSGAGNGDTDKKKLHILFITTAVLSVLIVVEDFLCLIPLSGAFVHGESKERNFCENIMQLVLAFAAIYAAFSRISLSFDQCGNESPLLSPLQEPEYNVTEQNLDRAMSQLSLTPRECEIFPYLLESMSYQKIGEELFISTGTVKAHTHNILQKVGVSNRHELLQWVSAL